MPLREILPAPAIRSSRGAASVEHVALVLAAAAIAIAGVGGARLLAAEPGTPALASALLRKQRCAVRHPDPCWQDPLTEAYGRALAGAARALAPAPQPLAGANGVGLVGVDYRRCRQPRCATPLPGREGERLTLSNRRTAAFTAVDDRRSGGGLVRIDYWLYRPTLGWELVSVTASAARVAELASTPLPESANPKLIPLETLLGRDEAQFVAGEEPPWRGAVESRWGR